MPTKRGNSHSEHQYFNFVITRTFIGRVEGEKAKREVVMEWRRGGRKGGRVENPGGKLNESQHDQLL